jgi:hypothetical protein
MPARRNSRRLKSISWICLATGLSIFFGCRAQTLKVPIQTAVVPTGSVSSAAPIASSPPPTHPNCEAIETQNKKTFDEALAKWEGSSFEDGGTASYDEVLPNPCILGTNSAWSVALQSFSSSTYPIFDATWSLVHVDSYGTILRYRDDSGAFTAGVGGAGYGPTKFWSFDFDDDGDPEIVFTYVQGGVENSDIVTEYVYQYKSGAIKPYVPVAGWTDLRDADNDGRPDAVEAYDVEDSGGCGIYETETLVGPTFVAHSVHGGFSTTDAVAKHVAMTQCPARPATIVAMKGKLIDETATATNAVCARAWGASEASVVHEIETRCHAMTCTSTIARARLPGECFHRETLISWAKQAPIVSLP